MKIENQYYELLINDKNGAILSFCNKKGKEFIYRDENRELFSMYMLNEEGDRCLLNSNQAAFSAKKEAEKTELLYKGLGGQNIDVTVTLRHPKNEAFVYWSLAFRNQSGLYVDKIDFPRVTVPNDLIATGGTARVFTSMMEGVVVEDITIRPYTGSKWKDAGYPSQGWGGMYPGPTPTQFSAYYDEKGGLYLAAHDAFCNPKAIEFCEDNGGAGIKLEFQLFPGVDKAVTYAYEYEMVMGVFEGDWYDAAEIYRTFVENSGIIKLPKLKDNENIPDWLKKSPIVCCYPVRGEVDSRFDKTMEYYPYTSAMPIVKGLQEDLNSAIMPLLMHWEGTAPWAPPYVWPPYGDFNNFETFIEELHASGNYIGVYCSGIAWTQFSMLLPSYNMEQAFEDMGIKDNIIVGPKQAVEYSRICQGGIRRGYDMCPYCKTTQDIAVTEFAKIVENCDVDYVQFFDQNLGGASYECYSRTHGHSFGPGKWKNEAMVEITDRMHAVLEQNGKKNKVLIGCESNAAEPFVNNFIFNDSRHNINYFIGNPVPAYNYIFHEYMNNFMGNQNSSYGIVDYQKFPENVYYRYAHAFVQGDILTIVLKDKGKIHWDWCTPWSAPEIDQKQIKAFIRHLNEWRKGIGKEALQYGRMIKPLAYECGVYREAIRYKGEHRYPSVESACYQTHTGKKQQFFVNFLPYEQTVSIVKNKNITVVEDSFGTTKYALNLDGTLVLPPRSVRMLELEE